MTFLRIKVWVIQWLQSFKMYFRKNQTTDESRKELFEKLTCDIEYWNDSQHFSVSEECNTKWNISLLFYKVIYASWVLWLIDLYNVVYMILRCFTIYSWICRPNV